MSRENSLVSADWVVENIENPKVAIIEVDEDTTLYAQGHIQNAITFNWREDLQDGLRRDIISKEGFEALLSKNGIANDTTVVLYGGNNNWFAAYAYWYFKLYGHQDVRLLDGGRKRWELDARPFVTDVPTRTATRYVAKDQDLSLRAFRDEVIAAIGVKNIVDVRSPAEFSGELAAPAHLPQEGGQVKGHVPTAKNIPWSKAANEDGTFKSQDELRGIYTSAGVDLGKQTIAYCRIGERSAFSWFVLHELLEVSDVKNYDGSWTEYGSLVGVPVEIGA
jgi:thiosulfate/3-mercaptopyruvate sulfurtransferase